jgi:superfamily II DNA/RNA helicase
VKRRLFMTATPRIYAPHITKKAKDEDVQLCSMDDHTIYGETVYKISFGQAIERNLITDYKVVVICITDAEVRKLVKKGSRVITTDNQEWDAEALAKRLALAKALDAYGFKKIFTFHGKVSGAKAFTDTESPYSIKQVIEMVGVKKYKQDEIEYFHVNGTMSSGERKSHLDEFKKAQIGIMSNARCLTEGVDIPSVDAIAFIDPKKSLIDIVQATGRAMRKAKGKDKGYIFVPVIVGEDEGPEECIESSDFKTVWQILQAMVEQDQNLRDKVSRLRVLQGKGEVESKEWKAAMAEYSENFEFFNLPGKIDVARFTDTLYTKAIEVIAKSWDFWYGLTLKYKQEFGKANVPDMYKTPDGSNLSNWQYRQRSSYNNGKLDTERIKILEKIGFIWDQLEEVWENGYQETIKYKKEFGNPNVPSIYKTIDGFKLGSWQSVQMKAYNKGTLNNERINKLEKIRFIWNKLEEAWEIGYQEILKYKRKFGDANVPQSYKTPEGFKLGSWLSEQRKDYKKGKLNNERIERLEDIGFICDQLYDAWERGYQEILKYKKQFGKVNTSNKYKTPEGFNLGMWQQHQKGNYNRGKLDKTRIKRLEDIGFIWDSLDKTLWERGYQETIKYKKEFGNVNAPQSYKTPEGFNLGMWQSSQKRNYSKGKLDKTRIKRLEDIEFIWDSLDKTLWENGYQITLTYKNEFGNVNAPQRYKTPGGFKLGSWLSEQRKAYNKGELDKDRIKILEDIGFVWDQREDAFEKGFQETLKYKKQFGVANSPAKYKTPEGVYLGMWQSNKRTNYNKGRLNDERIERLEEIGFVWDKFDDLFENGYQETLKYRKQFGKANTPTRYKTPDGFRLGGWQGDQKTYYNKGELDNERIKKLEDIGFVWGLLAEAWEIGYNETLKYRQQFGVANAPVKYKTLEGFNLGGWQSERRKSYKKGILEKDKIRRLEKIGFVWDMRKP